MPYVDKLTILSHQFVTEGEKMVDPFIVPTPVPYVVDLGAYTEEEKEKHVTALLISVNYLREIISTLGYTEKEAYDMHLTLNRSSWDKLYDEVIHRGYHELGKIMREKYGNF